MRSAKAIQCGSSLRLVAFTNTRAYLHGSEIQLEGLLALPAMSAVAQDVRQELPNHWTSALGA